MIGTSFLSKIHVDNLIITNIYVKSIWKMNNFMLLSCKKILIAWLNIKDTKITISSLTYDTCGYIAKAFIFIHQKLRIWGNSLMFDIYSFSPLIINISKLSIPIMKNEATQVSLCILIGEYFLLNIWNSSFKIQISWMYIFHTKNNLKDLPSLTH